MTLIYATCQKWEILPLLIQAAIKRLCIHEKRKVRISYESNILCNISHPRHFNMVLYLISY